MTRLHINASAISLAALFASYSAMAQQATATAGVGVQGQAAAATPATPPPPPVPAADANGQANQQNQTGMALPNATNANPPPAGNSEHDDMVGHLAVGFLGRASIPYGVDAAGTSATAPVPVVGVRYWVDPLIGLDLGAGLWIGGRSTDTTTPPAGNTVSVSGPKPFAMVLHAGVPLALASSKHFAFEIIPEANFGFAKVTQDAVNGGNDITKQSGTHFDLGARAGAEIHFGFIGIPQLSLVGAVGLRFQYDSLSRETNPVGGAGVTKISSSVWDLSTTLNGNPWDIFTGNISALFYL